MKDPGTRFFELVTLEGAIVDFKNVRHYQICTCYNIHIPNEFYFLIVKECESYTEAMHTKRESKYYIASGIYKSNNRYTYDTDKEDEFDGLLLDLQEKAKQIFCGDEK